MGQIQVNWDNGRRLAVIPEVDEYEIITEGESAGGASTTSSPGSGQAVGGVGSGDSGMNFTSAMGVSVYGGDSGTAFATNSNIAGMGQVVSPQPSSIPGDVRGGTKGSGDIGSAGGVYTKTPAGGDKKKKKKKKKSKRSQTAASIDKLYTTQYTQTDKGDGKIIQKWKTFKESLNENTLELKDDEIIEKCAKIIFEKSSSSEFETWEDVFNYLSQYEQEIIDKYRNGMRIEDIVYNIRSGKW
jgi:hypothetical protein